MPYYKAQHEVFIRALIRHGDQLAAYRQAYPKASKESAYTAAIRLLRQPHIQERVQAAMLAHREREQEREREREEHKRMMAEEDTLQKRIWLARVIAGEVMKQRYMRFRGRTILLHETLNPFITLAAIELDTKYEYATNPKIILDRQFARLYARAMRPSGERWLIRLQHAKKDSEKNTQNASKKLTNSKQKPRPAIHTASNNPAVCNKIKGRPARTSTASTHPATVFPAEYIIIDIESPPGDTGGSTPVILSEVECNETQGRIYLIKDTTTFRQILRDAQNDSPDGSTSHAIQSV